MKTRIALIALVLTGCSAQVGGTPQAEPGAGEVRTRASSVSTTVAPRVTGTDSRTCAFKKSDEPAARSVGMPDPAPPAPPAAVVLKTSQGDLRIQLEPAKARCAVHNFVFLSGKKFYDNTTCHRLTTTTGLKVLQCGDPAGTGAGGPGYSMQDEKPTGLTPAGSGAAVYPRGTVAMAKTQAPDSAGSQFFLVYGDSTIPPDYAVFGTLDQAALQALDKVAAAGLTPVNGEGDGTPKLTVTITESVVGG